MIPTVHPFPARMAPELALNGLKHLTTGCTVLDPMSGSGTVLRHAVELGHHAIGFDLDPLAVLMSRVWTRVCTDSQIQAMFDDIITDVQDHESYEVDLPWIDSDPETLAFVEYWFADQQRSVLRRIARSLFDRRGNPETADTLAVLELALSRIIVTKEQGASLARDTSHSRPHKVTDFSNYSVIDGFTRSVKDVRRRLQSTKPHPPAEVQLGDARNLPLPSRSVDAILTSPPYLNAIDYIRGHRLALVWLGYGLGELRYIRSTSIGAERAPDRADIALPEIRSVLGNLDLLPQRYQRMVDRYIVDILNMTRESARVLRSGAQATYVVGNSCLKGVYISNADAVARAAELAGMQLIDRYERELPTQSRYLPTPSQGALGRRMRVETILSLMLP